MKRIWSIVVFIVAALWAILSFIAANSPEDVEQRARSWASLPLVSAVPTWFLDKVSHPIALAIGFFVLGFLCAGYFQRWRSGRGKLSPNDALAAEISSVAYAIDGMSVSYSDPAVVAKLNVLLNKMKAQGFTMPPLENGVWNSERLSLYLHQIAAYLNDGQLEVAKQVSSTIVKNWPKPEQNGGFL